MRIAAIFLLATCCLFAGCSRESVNDGPTTPAPPPVDEAVAALIDGVGDRALLTVVVRPEGISKLGASLGPLFDAIGPPATEIKGALAAVESLPRLALGAEATGWDASRPIVLALFEPPSDGPIGAAGPVPTEGGGFQLKALLKPGLRHRVWVPARDPAALMAVLAARSKSMGFSVDGAGRSGTDHVRFFAEEGRVRIEAATHGLPPADWQSAPSPSARTPAFFTVASPDAPVVAMLMRPWQIRPVFTAMGQFQVAEAMAMAASSHKAALLAKGWAIVLQGEMAMGGQGAEFDDWGMALHAIEGGVELRSAASLTPAGRTAFARGGSHPALKLKAPALASLALTTDLRAIIDAATEPALFAQASKPREIAQGFAECGIGCNLHAATRQPLGVLKGIGRMATGQGVTLAASEARAAQLVLLGVDGERPQAAGAWQVPDGTDLSAWRTAIAQAPRGPEITVEMFTAPVGDGLTAVMVGLNVDPRTVFDMTHDAAGGFGQLSVRPAGLDAPLPPEARAIMKVLTGIEARSAVAGDALVGSLRVGVGAAIEAPPMPAGVAAEWPSPLGHRADTPGAACFSRAVRELSQAFDALAMAAPGQRGALFAAAMGELGPDFTCAEKEPELAPSVQALRRMLTITLLAMDADPFDPAPAIARFAPLCTAGDALACAEKTRLEGIPKVPLAAVDAASCSALSPLREGRTLTITADGALLDGEPLPIDAAARQATFLDIAARVETVRVGIDPARQWAHVKPIVGALSAAQVKARLAVSGPDGPVSLPIGLPARPPARPGIAPPDPRGDGLAPQPAFGIGGPDEERSPIVRFGPTALDVLDAGVFDAADADGRMAQLLARFPESTIYFEPAPETRWDRIVTIASKACGRARLGARPGPPPRADRDARLRELAARTGILGQLGGRQPELAGVFAAGDGSGDVFGDEPAVPALAPAEKLSKDVIRRVMRRHTARMRFCYQKALAKNPGLAGKITTRIVVAPDGSVSDAKLTGDTVGDEAVATCVLSQLRRVRMPAAAQPTVINWPVVFASE